MNRTYTIDPHTLCFQIACGLVGLREIKGSNHEAEIVRMFDEVGNGWIKDDETAWCAAAASWVLKKAGCEIHPQRAERIRARGFLEVGTLIQRDAHNGNWHKADTGDLVILWRGAKDAATGHVGFFVRQSDDHVYLLGGNQNNEFNISAYSKNRILEIRRPTWQ